MLEVSLSRFVDDEDPEYVSWSAAWGLKDNSSGTEHSCQDLDELIGDILHDSRHWGDRYDVSLQWTIRGDQPADGTIEDEIARLGITLPHTLDD